MELRSLTALFGANSSGKTALLQFLLLLKQTVESPDRQQVLNFGDGRSPISLGTFRDVVFRHEIPGRLELGVLWDLPKSLKLPMSDAANRGGREIDRLTFHVAITGNDKGRPVVDALRYQVGAVQSFAMTREPKARKKYELQSQYEGFKFRRPRGRPWPLPSPVKCYGFPPEVRTYYQNAEFLYDFELAFEELFGRVYYLGPLREHPRREYTWAGAQPAHMGIRGENVVDALLAARQRGQKISRGRRKTPFTVEEYVAWWLRELDLIHEFSVKRISQDSNLYTVWVKKAADATEVPLTDVGFGVSQILPVIALCYYVPKGSIVILEQPEIHLHPSV
ncbi:MAG: AAA family ATPase, partial [Deltaproteobacteria bacterium]|nr:AAA family ATPase [Deltaproteobacteria bacterium]